MKLTANEQGSLTNAGLFRPTASFEATLQPDGSIRLVELAPAPIAMPRRVNGRLRGADLRINRETLAAAVRAERDAR